MSEDYYQIFMTQFIQTLAQLSAAVLTTSLAVPLYNFYVKRTAQNKITSEEYEVNEKYHDKYDLHNPIDDIDDELLASSSDTSSSSTNENFPNHKNMDLNN